MVCQHQVDRRKLLLLRGRGAGLEGLEHLLQDPEDLPRPRGGALREGDDRAGGRPGSKIRCEYENFKYDHRKLISDLVGILISQECQILPEYIKFNIKETV